MDARQALLLMAGGESYQEAVLGLSPVGYWPLGEATPGTGVCRDLTGANNGTYVGSPTGGVAGPLVGDTSTAVTFNGTSQGATLAPGVHPGDVLSIVAWVSRTTSGASQAIIDLGVNEAVLRYDTTDHLVLRKAGVSDIFISTPTYGNAAWQMVAGTKNAGAVAMYRNGEAVAGTLTNATLLTGGVAGFIGSSNIPSNWFPGSLAHVAIWNRVLTVAEVAYLYAVGKGTA